MSRVAVVACLVASLSLAGACVPLPHRHLKRPLLDVEVLAANGAPVAGASFTLYTMRIVGRSLDTANVFRPDARGRIRIPRQHEWHLFLILVPDGEAPYVWAWCARAPGYRTAVGLIEDRLPRMHLLALLEPGSADLGCEPTGEALDRVLRAAEADRPATIPKAAEHHSGRLDPAAR